MFHNIRDKAWLAIILALLGACENNKDPIPYYSLMEENKQFISTAIKSASLNNNKMVFNSNGGQTSTALEIANEVKVNEISLVITDECFSNCAELILPAAKDLKFDNHPLIGFHGNVLSYQHYIGELTDTEFNTIYCGWDYAFLFRDQLIDSQVNADFWKEQMLRLKPAPKFKYPDKQCPQISYNFENHMWLPTSEQLRKLFGLNFTGAVCSDDFNKCRKRVDNEWDKGTRIIIGDQVYTSKGY